MKSSIKKNFEGSGNNTNQTRYAYKDAISVCNMEESVPIGVSNRHVHLSKKHLEMLFGENYMLKVRKMLRQPGQFAAEEMVMLRDKEEVPARIVGPLRENTQVEILNEDKKKLGTNAPVRLSGDITGTPGIILKGPKGEVRLSEGCIVAAKHLHIGGKEKKHFGLEGAKFVDLEIPSGKVFNRIPIRHGENHLSEFHIDKDEAKESGISHGQMIRIRKRHEE